jgi:hypothetical protein
MHEHLADHAVSCIVLSSSVLHVVVWWMGSKSSMQYKQEPSGRNALVLEAHILTDITFKSVSQSLFDGFETEFLTDWFAARSINGKVIPQDAYLQ